MGIRGIRIDDELVVARGACDLSPGSRYIRIVDTISRIAIRTLNNHSGRGSVTDNEGAMRCRRRIDSARLDFEADETSECGLGNARAGWARITPPLQPIKSHHGGVCKKIGF